MEVDVRSQSLLSGRKGLVVGIANEHSIAYGCARMFRECGAELAVTWLNDKARPHVEPLARKLEAAITLPLDVERDGETEAVFAAIRERWGRLDFVLHSVAFAPKAAMANPFLQTQREDFLAAHEISAYSLVALSRAAVPLMPEGGSIVTMTYYGSQKAVPGYNVMGVAKAALEASVRYLAVDLGQHGIRVNAISAGAINTLAARGVAHFRDLMRITAERSPLKRTVETDEVGRACLFLASELGSGVTGEVMYVDAGFNITAG